MCFCLMWGVACMSGSDKKKEPKKNNTKKKVIATLNEYRVWLSNLDSLNLLASHQIVLDSAFSKAKGRLLYYAEDVKDTTLSIKLGKTIDNGKPIHFTYSIVNDTLYYEDVKCETLPPVYLTSDSILVQRSYYNRENSADEESEIFWNKTCGLLVIYGESWGDTYLVRRTDKCTGLADSVYHYLIQHLKQNRIPGELIDEDQEINLDEYL